MMTLSRTTTFLLASALCVTGPAANAEGPVGEMALTADDVERFGKRDFSPYAGRNFPTRPLWGDTHLHTTNSLDARGIGVTVTPEDAFRFARGEEITSTGGIPVKLSRPLDWLVVSDHSDAMGAMNEIIAGNPTLLRDPKVARDLDEGE